MTGSDLNARLQEMLRLNGSGTDTSASSAKKPLIEVVEDPPDDKLADGGSTVESDDEPPPISFHGAINAAAASTSHQNQATASTSEEATPALSLAEQMMVDADRAVEEKKRADDSKRQKNASKATFGVKKGFLNSAKPRKRKSQKKPEATGSDKAMQHHDSKSDVSDITCPTKNNLIYELDSKGNMIPNTAQSRTSQSSIFTEAQDAMAANLASNTDWATVDLMETISKNPRLASGMRNPKFTAALTSMQTNPKGTMERLQRDDPEVLDFINEFCSVMGDHFCKLGEEKDANKPGGTKATNSNVGTAKIREMGVLEDKAMRKHKADLAKQKNQKSAAQNNLCESSTQDKDADEQVASILADDELRTILLDTKMQQIMQECATQDGKMQYYMKHEDYGPKLRKLIEAGLLRVA